jgi:hypothetical protein
MLGAHAVRDLCGEHRVLVLGQSATRLSDQPRATILPTRGERAPGSGDRD